MMVFFKGSTTARTRLYQMAIVNHWKEIEPLHLVFGLKDSSWQLFEKNINYDFFIVKRKPSFYTYFRPSEGRYSLSL